MRKFLIILFLVICGLLGAYGISFGSNDEIYTFNIYTCPHENSSEGCTLIPEQDQDFPYPEQCVFYRNTFLALRGGEVMDKGPYFMLQCVKQMRI